MNSQLEFEFKELFLKYSIDPLPELLLYAQTLFEINQLVNLTGSKTPEDIVCNQIADIFYASQALKDRNWPQEIWDVGAGGGIPGVPLAILYPHLQVHLVERRVKKAFFLEKIINKCNLLKRIKVHAAAFEDICPKKKNGSREYWFRGFLPGPKLIKYFSDHFSAGDFDRVICMKGPAWGTIELPAALEQTNVHEAWKKRFRESQKIEYTLPEGQGKRYLIML